MRAFLLALGALSAGVAQASDLEQCKGVATVAGSMMEVRQKGVDVTEAYDIAQASEYPQIARLATQLTTHAYQEPVMMTEEGKAEAVREFKARWMTVCMSKSKPSP